MKFIWYKIKSYILTIFGDLHIYKYPMFIVYNPNGYKINGDNIEQILKIAEEETMLVFMRGFDSYLDGVFIPIGVSKCSHSGIYIEEKVYHSIAEGVRKDSLIEFCRCDRLIILKPKKLTEKQYKSIYEHCEKSVGTPYDFDFYSENTNNKSNIKSNSAYYCHEFSASCIPKTWNIEKMRVKNKLGIIGPKIFAADSFLLNDHFEIVFGK